MARKKDQQVIQPQPVLSESALTPSSLMVSWFIDNSKAPLKMEEHNIGGHKYFLCLSSFTKNGEVISVGGRGQTKIEAATKCIGEWFERKAAFDFFSANPSHANARALEINKDGNFFISSQEDNYPLLPMEFWTTNGWAVHTDLKASQKNAFDEALERHLLVSSFLRWGWQGFIVINQVSVKETLFTSCLSRYKTRSHSAGFAISKHVSSPGLSFGHFSERSDSINQSTKWTHALYEAADKLQPSTKTDQSSDPIAIDTRWYLENQTDFDIAPQNTPQEVIELSSCYLHTVDLAQKYNLPFPLYGSFIFGGDLMPLFLPRELTESGREFIKALANSLGFDAVIPERMPVL